jgi:hypothetical protein
VKEFFAFLPNCVSDDCVQVCKKSSPVITPTEEPVTLGAEPRSAPVMALPLSGNVRVIICLLFC